MPFDEFSGLPDEARVWIYGFENPLTGADQRLIEERLSEFLGRWRAHDVEVTGAFAILYDRFVVLCGTSRDGISGCSIDRSVENFKELRDREGLDGLNRNLIYYRDGRGRIQAIGRDAFQGEVNAGRVGADTTVFDTTLPTLGYLRAGRFQVPLAKSWHAQLFRAA